MKREIVLITGAFSLIGRSIVELLDQAFSSYFILHHFHELTDEKKNWAKKLRNDFIDVHFNLEDVDKIDDFWNQIKERDVKNIDVLINNASVFYPTSLNKIDDSIWMENLKINLVAPALLCQKFIQQNCFFFFLPGRIINLLDCKIKQTMREHIPYHISKIGLKALTDDLANLAGPNFRINAVAPGYVKDIPQALIKKTVIQRLIQPEEVAQACLFLLKNNAVHGEVLYVDGGMDG